MPDSFIVYWIILRLLGAKRVEFGKRVVNPAGDNTEFVSPITFPLHWVWNKTERWLSSPNAPTSILERLEAATFIYRTSAYLLSDLEYFHFTPHFWTETVFRAILIVNYKWHVRHVRVTVRHVRLIHAGPAWGLKRHSRNNFCVFNPVKLKLCNITDFSIANNRMIFVFRF